MLLTAFLEASADLTLLPPAMLPNNPSNAEAVNTVPG